MSRQNDATDLTTVASPDSEMTFVDYAPPPESKVLPPAKYKLWLIVFVVVYTTISLTTAANVGGFLAFEGWLSPQAAQFLNFCLVVAFLTYGTLDLVITLLTFKIGDETYGLGAWMKQPRIVWVYRHDNLLCEILARVIAILENGFSMFDIPPKTQSVVEPKQFTSQNSECTTILKIEHYIKLDRLEDYNKWQKKIRKAMEYQNGIIDVTASEVRPEGDIEEGAKESTPVKSLHHTVCIKFINIDYLNDWMLSTRRSALKTELLPMLYQPDIVQVHRNRALPDAFTDLLIPQGETAPTLAPKKWKVWWITTLALFVTSKWINYFLPYYLKFWGRQDFRIERIITLFVATWLNSYIVTPLLNFFFAYWLERKEHEAKTIKEPWKTLDDGFQSSWPKAFITVAFYGGCLIAWLIKDYA